MIHLILSYSKHARDQMIARGISENEIKEAIQSGSKYLQKPDKIVAEYRYFAVAYKRFKDKYYIITVKPRW